MRANIFFKNFGKVVLIGAAGYMLVLGAGFIMVKYNVTNTGGAIDENNKDFQEFERAIQEASSSQAADMRTEREFLPSIEDDIASISLRKNYCRIRSISRFSASNARSILQASKKYDDYVLIEKMALAVKLKMKGNSAFQSSWQACENDYYQEVNTENNLWSDLGTATSANLFAWLNDEEWSNLRQALVKDQEVINRASRLAGLEPRLLVAVTMVEQSRLYYTQRGLYKQFFAPLKILGNATKFSLGIMGIKEKTALAIENNLKDKKSVFYLGPEYEHLLDFPAGASDAERYSRLTNEKDHFYSYLYGALYMKQLMEQWREAGFDISGRPEIASTLFNIGFGNSYPKADPEVGGAEIEIGNYKYSFGSLAYEFYYSGELEGEFGYEQ